MSLGNKKQYGQKNQKDNEKQRKCSNEIQLSVEQRTKMIILQAKAQLDQMIEHLDDKIRKRMQINECKFVVAYNNHLDKITRELKVLKQTYDTHERKFSADKALINLVKQCTLFRQQAMRLHSQLEDALTEANVYKRKSQILQKEMKNSDELAKRLITSNKILESQKLALIIDVAKKDEDIRKISIALGNMEKEKLLSEKKQKDIEDLHILIPKKTKNKSEIQGKQQNRVFTKRTKKTQESKTQQIDENYRYPIFQSNFDLINPSTPPFKKLTQKTKRRNKTSSTLCYRSKNENNNFESEKHGSERQYQTMSYKNFEHLLKMAKETIIKTQQTALIKSKNIGEFINNNQDISNFCHYLFPDYKIQSNQKQDMKTERNISSVKLKTLTYLSSELMKKFKLTKAKMQKNNSENTIHLSSDELKFISEKSRLKTQFQMKKSDTDPKQERLKRMNQSFKRKTVFNKSVLSFAQRSARVMSRGQ